MAIHPHCPCSRASIGELSILMTRSRSRMTAFVLFVEPPGFGDAWTKTDLWSSAGAITGVTRLIDRGAEATLFNAATSGQTMVYDRRGHLIFSGGITAARGHLGDNSGVTSIAALIDTPASSGLQRIVAKHLSATNGARTPVYGCPLFAPSTRRREQLKCEK
jgi:hypothetical protein